MYSEHIFRNMVTKRDAVWSTALEMAVTAGSAGQFDIDDVIGTMNEAASISTPTRRMVRDTLKSMSETGVLQRSGGKGRSKALYRLNPDFIPRPDTLSTSDTQDVDISDRPLDGKAVVLVGCGDSKRNGKHAAKDLYDSNYFDLKREYGETVGDSWYIVSAEYGLLAPNEVVETYDTHISEVDIRAWEEQVSGELPDLQGATVQVLAGEEYIQALDLTLDLYAENVEYPTRGLSIGKRMQWLKENIPSN